jgi:TRAP-type C4-dicarboxylate transport system substrate-binding protein
MKHIQKTIRLFLAVASFAALMFGSSVFAQDHVVWRLGHTLTVPGSLYEKIITEEIPERISQASDGMIRVQPLIGVVGTNDILNALQTGRVQMGSLTVAYSAATHPLWAVLNLPGLVTNKEQIGPIARAIVQPKIAKDMEKWGINPAVVVSWDGGAYFSNRRIEKVEDFSGPQWRTHAPMLSQLIEELGGSTIGMPFEELYPSLERGLVDAYTTTVPAMHAARLDEVTKYVIEAPQGTSLAVVMVSDAALNSLPDDVRKNVVAELKAINNEVGPRLYQEYIDLLQGIREEGGMELIKFSDEEAAKVTEIAKKTVWSKWLEATGERGEQLIQKIQSATE